MKAPLFYSKILLFGEYGIIKNSKGLSIGPENILVTNGVSEGLDMVISSIVEEGDEVLLPGPYYPPYASYVRLHGGKPIEFAVDLKNSRPDIDDIKAKISSKTVAICLISPNNPTGLIFDEKSLKQIVDIANEHNFYLICDEIYDKIIFDQEGIIAIEWGAYGVPESFLIKDGIILKRYIGPIDKKLTKEIKLIIK